MPLLSSTNTAKMLVVVLLFLSALGRVSSIRLDGNGYTDILIAINPNVPENEELINQIKEMVVNGSKYLFEALDHKVFFNEVKILVPTNWMTGKYERAKTETFDKGKIRIDVPHPAFGNNPYTRHTQGCGIEAEYVHFTPDFLLDSSLIDIYGPKGRVFVHEWAHLRWGVFDEYNMKDSFYLSAGKIQHTRCSEKISGEWYEIINQNLQPCQIDGNGLPTSNCEFIPYAKQNTNGSIMYMQSIDTVRAFCQEEEHNFEAPNEQNAKCQKASSTVIFQDSVDAISLRNLKPLQSELPAPIFKVIQRGPRVVCLILDVSGSMNTEGRITRQKQAATVFLQQVIDDQQFVALVTFSTNAAILNSLTKIDGPASRQSLISKLPTSPDGYTYICKGLKKGFEALRADDGKTIGDEIIFLTDGEATDSVQDCLEEAVQSGAIIHTIALGPSADNVLRIMANRTGGIFRVAKATISSNELVDAFSAMSISDGNLITQPIQVESTGKLVTDWFNGTIPIDQTVGNHTTFTLIYESSAPTVYIRSPSGSIYDERNTTDTVNTITLTVPGTAEPGNWEYSFLNKHTHAQQMSLTVMSRAARKDIYPVTVTARMNQQTSDGTSPMVVVAEVIQNYSPVLRASVWAALESDTGHSEKLKLLDNGAGADAFKDDGVYSRYFMNLKKGKYSLKVRVENQEKGVQFSPYRHSAALYVPGYIVDGEVKLNPPKPPVNIQPVDVGSFSRTVTGDSFEVEADAISNFPPNQISDLSAEIQKDTVVLNWTAPGEDFDKGTAKSYDIRWSEDLKMLRMNFTSANAVNTSAILPQESGSAEQHSFQPNITIKNGTTIYFAIQSMDTQAEKSEVSNIARAVMYVQSPRPPSISNEGLNPTAVVVSVCVVTIVTCVITVIITWALKRKSRLST